MCMERVYEGIRASQDKYVEILKKLVAQPSISAQKKGVNECAHLLEKIMEEVGIETKQYETCGHPLLYGEIQSPRTDAKTILFYGHYDVQPPEPLHEWKTPPFEPAILGGRLYGRGVADNKGQLIAHIFAVDSYLQEKGSLPVHVKFLFEGDEEIGSPYLSSFVKENRDLLSTDLVYSSDGPMDTSGAPTILFGVRGILSFEISLETSIFDNHSGNKGGVIPNAAWEIVQLLGTMVDAQGNVLIQGFYDDILPPNKYEEELMEDLPFHPQQIAKDFGVPSIGLGKSQFYRRLSFEPTFSINGLLSGYTGEGTKTIIPGSALAKFDIRLVPNMDPFDILEKVKKHVSKENKNVEICYQGHMYPSRTKPDLLLCQKIVAGVEKAYGEKAILIPSAGGSLPDYVWTRDLGVPSILVPYANADEANHSPNENLKLDCFFKGIMASAQILYELEGE